MAEREGYRLCLLRSTLLSASWRMRELSLHRTLPPSADTGSNPFSTKEKRPHHKGVTAPLLALR